MNILLEMNVHWLFHTSIIGEKYEFVFALWQPDSIHVMGDKSTARETMKNAGVPTVPGSDGLLQVSCLANIWLL